MRYNTTINNIKAHEWGLNIQQAYLFAWFYELPSWSGKMVLENKVYYFASKSKAVKELPLLTEKIDTMYRYYRQIEDLGLIEIKKIDNKDYIYLTDKAKQWNGNKSDHSETNPTILGNKSDNNSEINPTYNNININTKINKENTPQKFCFKSELIKLGLNEKLCNEWLDVRKKKRGINTERSLGILTKQLELSGLDINQLIEIAVNKGWVMPEAKYRDIKEASIKLTSIDVRRANFKAEILKFNNEVDVDTLKKFFAHYTQVNDGMMKFEAEEYFNVRNRLFNFKSK